MTDSSTQKDVWVWFLQSFTRGTLHILEEENSKKSMCGYSSNKVPWGSQPIDINSIFTVNEAYSWYPDELEPTCSKCLKKAQAKIDSGWTGIPDAELDKILPKRT